LQLEVRTIAKPERHPPCVIYHTGGRREHDAGGSRSGAAERGNSGLDKVLGNRLESDWQVGSTVTWMHDGVAIEDSAQVVLEAEPPHRLAYTWHTFTPGWTDSWGVSEEFRAK
jgi:Activator of Hsp90 ATPase homolog 1-like protein